MVSFLRAHEELDLGLDIGACGAEIGVQLLVDAHFNSTKEKGMAQRKKALPKKLTIKLTEDQIGQLAKLLGAKEAARFKKMSVEVIEGYVRVHASPN